MTTIPNTSTSTINTWYCQTSKSNQILLLYNCTKVHLWKVRLVRCEKQRQSPMIGLKHNVAVTHTPSSEGTLPTCWKHNHSSVQSKISNCNCYRPLPDHKVLSVHRASAGAGRLHANRQRPRPAPSPLRHKAQAESICIERNHLGPTLQQSHIIALPCPPSFHFM